MLLLFFIPSMTGLAYIFYVFHDNVNIEFPTMRCHWLLLSCRINVAHFIIAWIKILIYNHISSFCIYVFICILYLEIQTNAMLGCFYQYDIHKITWDWIFPSSVTTQWVNALMWGVLFNTTQIIMNITFDSKNEPNMFVLIFIVEV